ncbi:hypothetical protein SEVIR_6G224851v4 [Setaria viridis]
MMIPSWNGSIYNSPRDMMIDEIDRRSSGRFDSIRIIFNRIFVPDCHHASPSPRRSDPGAAMTEQRAPYPQIYKFDHVGVRHSTVRCGLARRPRSYVAACMHARVVFGSPSVYVYPSSTPGRSPSVQPVHGGDGILNGTERGLRGPAVVASGARAAGLIREGFGFRPIPGHVAAGTGRCLTGRPGAERQQRRDRRGGKGARDDRAGPARTSGGARAAPPVDCGSQPPTPRVARSPGK